MVTLPPGGPKSESLSHIDITKLSQSELHALSLCSDSALDLRPPNDVVSPQINPSFFNQSPAALRQTFSRHHHHHAALRHRLPSLSLPERAENSSIVNSLKHLLSAGAGAGADTSSSPAPVLRMQMGKRKREVVKLKPSGGDPANEVELEIVNENGVVVDLKALESNGDESYAGEFRRRTVGLESEEQFLGFLGGFEGQWGSRRRKRRFVSACEFGDWLPVGWKLLLALRRKDGRVSVYCRRYIRWWPLLFVSVFRTLLLLSIACVCFFM